MFYERYGKKTRVFKELLNTPLGKEFLKYFAEEVGAYKSSFVPGDPNASAYKEGLKQSYWRVMELLGESDELIRKAIEHEHKQIQLQEALRG